MPTSAEVTHEVQDKMLDSIRVGQQGVVNWVRSLTEIAMAFSKLPESTPADRPPKPGQAFESTFEFTEKVVKSYWEFVFHVFDAAWPAAKVAPAAATKAASDKS